MKVYLAVNGIGLGHVKRCEILAEKLKKNGNKITYEALCFSFDKSFIEKCKENKILIVLPNGCYDFGSGN